MREARAAWRRVMRPGESERGLTLVELMVSMMIFAGLLGIVFSVLVTVSQQTKDNLARTRSADQARIGLMQIDRQVRSGNVISDPAGESLASAGVPANYSLRVYTQTDGSYQCVQWRVRYPAGTDRGLLEFRSWRPSWQVTGGVEAWRVVARDVVRPTGTFDPDDNTTWPPFFVEARAGSAGSEAQTIRVTLRLKDANQSARSAPTTVTSVLTGRNTVFGYPADSCGTVPAP
ncbi:PilW family protein [Cellulomonas xiejunii]|uniref:Prepilin-type N-terminal cleavage/methylation domain-containing protein n=1 Tax=Cellulomonas xiejunii TaxID=2968083 RepID=A0ABY5KUT5_9CELL|nr:prepilin-type N-terminal cleavage/methylation domain-containing protein [Cellulomonas xiejunii]MCC2314816.1 prepilin-type N-terminal cleavage/methylation domain-containing protein [Cellulomonas xiejunii]MCC2323098.1 prepilin-type N-terminal cleavage/methylation domain-containing protein [Cellulomonas xiejunii]UUI73588.1 prepilin-type N-terminal cleavage/methylation domain-containing protein [Cellulomonas xiejunii]